MLFLLISLFCLSVTAHSNNYAILVSTSRFWFNYRHSANVLSLYHTVKALGVPDSQIILALADDAPCNGRNRAAGSCFNDASHSIDLYAPGEVSPLSGVQVDQRGEAVTVASFLSILSGKWSADTPENLRLRSGPDSNLLVYMTGHGGDGFLKFQDAEEISAQDLADAFHAAYVNGKYGSALFLIDTCQGATMFSRFYAPNVVAIASSALGENSYSHHADNRIGVAIIDRFTFYLLSELSRISMNSTLTLSDLFDRLYNSPVHSTVQWRTDLLRDRRFEDLLVTDYFGMVQQVSPIVLPSAHQVDPAPIPRHADDEASEDEVATVRAAVARAEALLAATSADRLAASLPSPVAPIPFSVRNPTTVVPLVLVGLFVLVAFSVAVNL